MSESIILNVTNEFFEPFGYTEITADHMRRIYEIGKAEAERVVRESLTTGGASDATIRDGRIVGADELATTCPICSMPLDDADGGCVRHSPEDIEAYLKTVMIGPPSEAESKFIQQCRENFKTYINIEDCVTLLKCIRSGEIKVPGMVREELFTALVDSIKPITDKLNAERDAALAEVECIKEERNRIKMETMREWKGKAEEEYALRVKAEDGLREAFDLLKKARPWVEAMEKNTLEDLPTMEIDAFIAKYEGKA